MTLQGRRALVTAGSSGIGAAIAEALRGGGAEVFITGTGEHTPNVAEKLGAAGWALADFTTPGAAAAAAAAALERLGGVDILVANTGGPRAGPMAVLTAADWDSAYRSILDSAITLTNEVLPSMRESGCGRLIYITSVGVVRPLPQMHLSNVMRAGVMALARSVAAEVAPMGITTHVLAPAHVDTARRRGLVAASASRAGATSEEIETQQLRGLPVGRWGRPEEIGDLVAYLCSDSASFQTGALHVLDGGMMLV